MDLYRKLTEAAFANDSYTEPIIIEYLKGSNYDYGQIADELVKYFKEKTLRPFTSYDSVDDISEYIAYLDWYRSAYKLIEEDAQKIVYFNDWSQFYY